MSGHWEPVMQWVEDDDEEDFEEDEDGYAWCEEQRRESEMERLSQCTCGAYVWSDKRAEFVHVADCICGNT